MIRLARLALIVVAHDDDDVPGIWYADARLIDERVADSPYMAAELLRGMMRDAGDELLRKARAIATTKPEEDPR